MKKADVKVGECYKVKVSGTGDRVGPRPDRPPTPRGGTADDLNPDRRTDQWHMS